jgi:hypothetical protein
MSSMADVESMARPTFITLGPEGTDHERATLAYIDFLGLKGYAELELVDDLADEGIQRVHDEPNSFLLQCSAHLEVHLATERYPQKVVVGDTFIFPTRDLSLLVREGVDDPETIALVPATHGYTDLSKWKRVVNEQSKPVISRKLVEGEYDAGITFTELADKHPGVFRIAENYGEVDTTWIIYGKRKRTDGELINGGRLIGNRTPWYFTGQPEPQT